jgi:hypothetical protein
VRAAANTLLRDSISQYRTVFLTLQKIKEVGDIVPNATVYFMTQIQLLKEVVRRAANTREPGLSLPFLIHGKNPG